MRADGAGVSNRENKMDIQELFDLVASKNASDLLISAGALINDPLGLETVWVDIEVMREPIS